MKHSIDSWKLGQLIHAMLVLAGVLTMAPMVKAILVYGRSHHPVATLGFILFLMTAIFWGSRQQREAAHHFIHQVFQLENLMMADGQEAKMLDDRERITGENQSLEFWR